MRYAALFLLLTIGVLAQDTKPVLGRYSEPNTGTAVVRDTLDLSQGRVIYDSSAYGELYTATAITRALTSDAAYYRLETLTVGDTSVVTAGPMKILVRRAGVYKMSYSAAFTANVNNTLVHASIHRNGVDEEDAEGERKIGTAGDFGSMSAQCLKRLYVNDTIDVRFKADKDTDMTVNHFNFSIHQLK